MKKKITIILMIIILEIVGIPKTYAANPEEWAINLTPAADVRWFNCTSETSCETQQTYEYISQYNQDTGETYPYVIGGNTQTIATNGILQMYRTPVILNKDYVYNLNVYHCSNKNLSGATFQLYSNTYANRGVVTGDWANYTGNTTLSKYAFTNQEQTANYCYLTQTLFRADSDTSWIFLKIKSPNNSITGYVPAFISVEAEPLGLYKNVIETIVTNAIRNGTTGLATSSQLTQAQNNINSTINSGANQVSDSVDNVNDTLTQNHTYNSNASETIQGQSDINNMENKEQQVMNSIDVSGVEDIDITIDGDSSTYIWGIVNRLRQINPAIVLLVTSILGLGIMKMILNR